MNRDLERYLNDHHAASCGAVKLIQKITELQEDEAERDFYSRLNAAVQNDQTVLRELIEKAGLELSTTLQVVGKVSESVGRLKLMWEGFEPGELGMFEALEILTLGIQGKRQLWLMLSELAPYYPEWSGYDFAALELAAIEQRDDVETRRIQEGLETFLNAKRRAARLPNLAISKEDS